MLTLLRLVARMPLRLVHAIGALLGWVTYAASPAYRTRLRDHAALAGCSAGQRRAAVAHAGRMVAELPWLWLAPADRKWAEHVRWKGDELIAGACAEGRGLLLLTPHLGCFEVVARAIAERWGRESPLTVMYRPARKAWLQEVMARNREAPGLRAVPASLAGVREMLRALRRGEAVGLLPDQVPPEGMGLWAPFFGRPAYTMTLATRLADQTGAAVLLLWARRETAGRGWTIEVVRPDELEAAACAESTGLAVPRLNSLMEALIRRCPEQYLWGYHRFKSPRGSGSAPAAGALS